jgi:hypothetical protein
MPPNLKGHFFITANQGTIVFKNGYFPPFTEERKHSNESFTSIEI